MNVQPRTAWQSKAQPVTGPAMNLATVTMLVAHYTAANTIPDGVPGPGASHDAVAAYLRSIQDDYTRNRGYSIGYNFAVDQSAQAWECRGWDIKCAANKGPDSGPNLNGLTIAVLCLVDGANPLTPAMVATFQELAAEANKRTARTLRIVGHRDIDATACPGDGIYHQVTTGALAAPKPDPAPAPPPKENTDMDPFTNNAPGSMPGDVERPARFYAWTWMPDGTKRHIGQTEAAMRGIDVTKITAQPWEWINQIPDYAAH